MDNRDWFRVGGSSFVFTTPYLAIEGVAGHQERFHATIVAPTCRFRNKVEGPKKARRQPSSACFTFSWALALS